MIRRVIVSFVLFWFACVACFGQASALREYVGMISQTFHPDVISYMEKAIETFRKRGDTATVRGIEHYIRGDSGTGFVYVAPDGTNYILTNFHVISHTQIDGLSITFENTDGEKTKFSNLSIFAADEEMDIALLVFAEGQRPFTRGLAFLERPVQEMDDVFSAGFPGLGTAMIWQLGRGMVSNASTHLPDNDDDTKMIGPFIQHTAQIDPGNSGGPLLVQVNGVPTGFAVAGINTLSVRFRQGTNYSIPMNRVRSFLDTVLVNRAAPDRDGLESRVDSFIQGLDSSKAAYPHIAKYLSNICTAENFEYAEAELFRRADRAVIDDIAYEFGFSPVTGMSYTVAWTIENAIRYRGEINILKNSITMIDEKNYTVDFMVNNKIISSQWTNEYGIWRIKTFGDFAAGDKSLIGRRPRLEGDERLRTNFALQVTAGYAHIFERGPGFGANLLLKGGWTGYGLKTNIAKDFFQLDFFSGVYIPIRAETVAFIPFGNIGLGMQFYEVDERYSKFPELGREFNLSFSIQGGFQFTTAAVPGLYFQGVYQHNFNGDMNDYRKNDYVPPDTSVLIFSIGYAF